MVQSGTTDFGNSVTINQGPISSFSRSSEDYVSFEAVLRSLGTEAVES